MRSAAFATALVAAGPTCLAQSYPVKPVRVVLPSPPGVRDSLQQQGADAAPSTPEAFGECIRSEIAKWAKLVKSSGARPE